VCIELDASQLRSQSERSLIPREKDHCCLFFGLYVRIGIGHGPNFGPISVRIGIGHVPALSRVLARRSHGKIFSTPRLSQIPTITKVTKPQSVSFRYSDLGLQRCRLVGALSYLMAIAVVSSLCALDSNNKSCFVDNSQLQKAGSQ